MRTRLTIALIILLLLAGNVAWFMTTRKLRDKLSTAENNLSEQVRTNGEETRVLRLSRDEYQEMFADQKRRADSIAGRKAKVIEHTRVVYEVDIDTVLQVRYIDPIQYTNDWIADFNSGCITSTIHYIDTAGVVEITSTGEIPIDIVEYLKRKKGWFWKLQWGKRGWESHTKVSTPCRLTIKENVKFEIH